MMRSYISIIMKFMIYKKYKLQIGFTSLTILYQAYTLKNDNWNNIVKHLLILCKIYIILKNILIDNHLIKHILDNWSK
jgi:hypothetical protein